MVEGVSESSIHILSKGWTRRGSWLFRTIVVNDHEVEVIRPRYGIETSKRSFESHPTSDDPVGERRAISSESNTSLIAGGVSSEGMEAERGMGIRSRAAEIHLRSKRERRERERIARKIRLEHEAQGIKAVEEVNDAWL